ncbi:MAG TPA: DUF4159 domain-containing protein [Planctomycetota bacterium]|nr:DUF4159 domain-containing protein [Planctomycetota bacterium]
MRWKAAAILVVLMFLSAASHAQTVSLDQTRDAIREGCERLMKTQQPDGSFVLDKHFFEVSTAYVFPVGQTALAVLALQHALPHLSGETYADAEAAIQKGLAYITQRKPEALTYSAGLVISVLYKADPTKHRRLIGLYAEMLVLSQQTTGRDVGFWGYYLHYPPRLQSRGEAPRAFGRADHSNTQFAVLGLYYAQLAGFQIPERTWLLLRKHYLDFQNQDGGWHYGPTYAPKESNANMTLVCTISLAICNEMLGDRHEQCKPTPESRPVEAGLAWVAANLDYDQLETYGFYATERLGILSGFSEFGGKSWFDEGASRLVKDRRWRARNAQAPGQEVGAAFAVLFLARGLEPVIINKLKRQGDWNNHLHDVKHLVEYVSDRFQKPKQWRIVTLDADVDFLLRVPILWISGHDPLNFSDAEKAKLKAYVERGGTLLGEACCSKKAFDDSFRKLLASLWPGSELREIRKDHPIYTDPRPLRTLRPKILGLASDGGQGRFSVLYLPNGISCQWERGGSTATPAFDVVTNIVFYVEKTRQKPEAAPTAPTAKP